VCIPIEVETGTHIEPQRDRVYGRVSIASRGIEYDNSRQRERSRYVREAHSSRVLARQIALAQPPLCERYEPSLETTASYRPRSSAKVLLSCSITPNRKRFTDCLLLALAHTRSCSTRVIALGVLYEQGDCMAESSLSRSIEKSGGPRVRVFSHEAIGAEAIATDVASYGKRVNSRSLYRLSMAGCLSS
jgi:hypothetical protein